MTLGRNLMLALTVTGGAAVAAVLAFRHRARRLEDVQHRTDLQTWENEGGTSAEPASAKLPSRSEAGATVVEVASPTTKA